jgi:hypothetical protein
MPYVMKLLFVLQYMPERGFDKRKQWHLVRKDRLTNGYTSRNNFDWSVKGHK